MSDKRRAIGKIGASGHVERRFDWSVLSWRQRMGRTSQAQLDALAKREEEESTCAVCGKPSIYRVWVEKRRMAGYCAAHKCGHKVWDGSR